MNNVRVINAVFISDENDAEDVITSLKEWFYGHEVGMEWHSISSAKMDLKNFDFRVKGDEDGI